LAFYFIIKLLTLRYKPKGGKFASR